MAGERRRSHCRCGNEHGDCETSLGHGLIVAAKVRLRSRWCKTNVKRPL
jgi:hypothetical protein